jgi:nuclear protein localization family protein 4
MFENAQIVDRFLSYWRTTGSQRLGFLYGRYEVFDDVPLGVKAVVAAIYEPPQECSRDGIKLIPDDKEEKVEELAKLLGLKRVGWIFTDLIQDAKGNVKHFRNIGSHFLSAQECIMAGHFQSKYPNACRLSSTSVFGSKFCTVLVTGNAENQVHMEGYQVSNQCTALTRDKCLIPTKDAPELGYIKESTSEQYVPDVFFKEKDKYGNDVTKIARPLPVEYLLIDVPASTPLDPVFTFYAAPAGGGGGSAFPIENRPMEGHLQDFGALATYRQQFQNMRDFFRDFHLLLYLATQTVNPLFDHMKPLLEAVRESKEDAIIAFSKSEHWQTIELLLDAHNGGFH